MKSQLRSRIAIAAAVALSSGIAAAQISFEGPVAWATGADPEAVVAADFDGDGDVDLLSTIHSPARLSLLRNRGDGTFGAPEFTVLTVGVDPAGIVAADVDFDGDLDVAVTFRESEFLKLLLNDGNGSFTGGQALHVGARPNDVVAFAFDADSDVDFACSNEAGNSVAFVRLVGPGQIEVSDKVIVGTLPKGLAIGSFAGDSRPDVVVAVHGGHKLVVLRNDGGGDFSIAASLVLPTNEKPEWVGVADIDHDGLDDILATVSDSGTNELVLVRQLEPSVFALPQYHDTGGIHPVGILLHDFDLDTWTDVATVNSVSNTLAVLRNVGGNLAGAQIQPLLGPASDFVTCGDLDGNHYADLVCTNDGGNSVSVLRNLRTNPGSYCSTSPNSVGPGARMGSRGLPSLSTNEFALEVSGAPRFVFGLFFYGRVPQEIPFQSGNLCIRPPLVRLGPPVPTTRYGTMVRRLDLEATSGPTAITAGSTWNFQFWYRDAAFAPGVAGTTNLSDGWRVVFDL
jgi:hypothetical protein